MISLYEYQKDLINKVRLCLIKKTKKICVVSPCGSGKSIVQGMITANATKKGNRVLFIVHRRELCDQIKGTFTDCNVHFDLCQVGMVQTICRNLDKYPIPDIIITDETHHSLANSYIKIYEYFNKAILLGFTATPTRLNKEGLNVVYDDIVLGPSVEWLIDNKRLSPYKLYSVKLADTSNLHIRQGDFKKDEMNSLMEDNKIYGDTIINYKKLANGKKTIVYCASINSSIETAKAFNIENITAKHLDAKTPKKEREQAIQDFRDNKITVLCNVNLFDEGFDVPDCECVILLRPTKSLSLFIQQSMRSMRYKPEKEATIIDHVGNVYEHGLPDMKHDWTLKGKKKKEEEEEKIRECPKCYACFEPNKKICPYCGYEFKTNLIESKKLTDNEIILQEIKKMDFLKKQKPDYYKNLNTLSDLIRFQRAKNFKIGWLTYKIEERKDYLKMTFEDFREIQKTAKYKFNWIFYQLKKYDIEIPEKYRVYEKVMNFRR